MMTMTTSLPSLIQTPSFNPNEFKEYCIRVFSHVKPGSTFLSINNYENNWSELSNFSVCFNVDYLHTVQRSFNIVKAYNIKRSDARKCGVSVRCLKDAKKQILHSFSLTLSGKVHPAYTCAGVYDSILGMDNKPIPGIKLHPGQDVVHINAVKFKKKVLRKGLYPSAQLSADAIAKRFIKNMTPISNWVQFKLIPGRFDKLSVMKMKIQGR